MSIAHFSEGAAAFLTPIQFTSLQRLEINSLTDEKTGRIWHHFMRNSCFPDLVSGITCSLVTKHPLPFIVGLSACFPRVFAQKKIGGEFQVNTYTNGTQYFPSVTALSSGNFVVSWQCNGQDGAGYGVFGQIFNATGAKFGSEFQVNTYTTGNQDSTYMV